MGCRTYMVATVRNHQLQQNITVEMDLCGPYSNNDFSTSPLSDDILLHTMSSPNTAGVSKIRIASSELSEGWKRFMSFWHTFGHAFMAFLAGRLENTINTLLTAMCYIELLYPDIVQKYILFKVPCALSALCVIL